MTELHEKRPEIREDGTEQNNDRNHTLAASDLAIGKLAIRNSRALLRYALFRVQSLLCSVIKLTKVIVPRQIANVNVRMAMAALLSCSVERCRQVAPLVRFA